jgi:LysM repeat protein
VQTQVTDDRRASRLRATAIFFRRALILSLLLNIILLAVIVRGYVSRNMAHAILIDGELECLVRSEKAANQVREAILAAGKGEFEGEASLKQNWEDKPWPVKDDKVFTNEEAIELLKPKLDVVVTAYAIQVEGRDILQVPAQETAEEVLRTAKAKFLSEGETPLEPQSFKEEPVIAQTQVPPDALIADIHTATEELLRGTTAPQKYSVQVNDTPYSVAKAHNMTVDQLYKLNPGLKEMASRNDIHPGDEWTVAGPRPGLVVITKKETTRVVPVPYSTVAKERPSLPAGETRVVRAGHEGQRKEWIRGTWRNDQVVPESVKVTRSEIIEEPQDEVVFKGTGPPAAAG